VIVIPSHKEVPVCVIKPSPDGSPDYVTKDTYYIRDPKPESVPITTYEQWKPLIHRCVIHESDELLKSIYAIVKGKKGVPAKDTDLLKSWHILGKAKYDNMINAEEKKFTPLYPMHPVSLKKITCSLHIKFILNLVKIYHGTF